MSPILRRLLYVTLACFLLLALLNPYNWICRMSGKCNEIILSNILPTVEGNRQITVVMEAINQRSDIEFEAIDPKLFLTVSGRKNSTTYRVKNLSDQTVKFRPEFTIEPKEMSKYISRDQCLCFREYKIKKGEEIILPVSFRLKSKIDQDQTIKPGLMIRLVYTAKN